MCLPSGSAFSVEGRCMHVLGQFSTVSSAEVVLDLECRSSKLTSKKIGNESMTCYSVNVKLGLELVSIQAAELVLQLSVQPFCIKTTALLIVILKKPFLRHFFEVSNSLCLKTCKTAWRSKPCLGQSSHEQGSVTHPPLLPPFLFPIFLPSSLPSS
jgi:hypothetical protein